jgi:hypothetical protein
MSLDVVAVLDGIVSHALASGLFERVNTHEPENPPGNGLSAAVWADRIEPARSSGLAATSVRVAFLVRIYASMLQEPADAIDPDMLTATSTLLGAYSGDFELGGSVRQIDLLGTAGVPLSAQAGYITQDSVLYRVMTIVLPVIVNDVWEQAP